MIAIPDPVRPYLALIRIGLWCLLVGGIFVAGCQRGESSKQAEADRKVAAAGKAQAKAEELAAERLASANACGAALAESNSETLLAKQRSDEWKQAANIADARAAKASSDAAVAAARAGKALQAAKAKPACATQLAMTLCPEIPLL